MTTPLRELNAHYIEHLRDEHRTMLRTARYLRGQHGNKPYSRPAYYLDKAARIRRQVYDALRPVDRADRPMPGDAVRLVTPWNWGLLDIGAIGVIGGMVGEYSGAASITFRASTYRDDKVISCSGGPGTIATGMEELQPTGDTVDLRVWRFKGDHALAHNGIDYITRVAVWEWSPDNGGGYRPSRRI